MSSVEIIDALIEFINEEFSQFKYMDLDERKETLIDIIDRLENDNIPFEFLEDIEIDISGKTAHHLNINNGKKEYYIDAETYRLLM